MDSVLFQILCLVILGFASVWTARRDASGKTWQKISWIALAAGLGEHTCIEFYAFYSYAPFWWLRLGHVPLLIALIWPLVILSAEEVGQELRPGQKGVQKAFLTAFLVFLDASLVEIIAVRAGLWTWVEGGILEVPLIGLAGWSIFSFWVVFLLEKLPTRRWWLLPPLAIAGTHLGLLALWWGALRHGLRGDLGVAGLAGLGSLVLLAGLVIRRGAGRISLSTVLPRLPATALFLVLFLLLPGEFPWAQGLYFLILGAFYSLLTRWSLEKEVSAESSRPVVGFEKGQD